MSQIMIRVSEKTIQSDRAADAPLTRRRSSGFAATPPTTTGAWREEYKTLGQAMRLSKRPIMIAAKWVGAGKLGQGLTENERNERGVGRRVARRGIR